MKRKTKFSSRCNALEVKLFMFSNFSHYTVHTSLSIEYAKEIRTKIVWNLYMCYLCRESSRKTFQKTCYTNHLLCFPFLYTNIQFSSQILIVQKFWSSFFWSSEILIMKKFLFVNRILVFVVVMRSFAPAAIAKAVFTFSLTSPQAWIYPNFNISKNKGRITKCLFLPCVVCLAQQVTHKSNI